MELSLTHTILLMHCLITCMLGDHDWPCPAIAHHLASWYPGPWEGGLWRTFLGPLVSLTTMTFNHISFFSAVLHFLGLWWTWLPLCFHDLKHYCDSQGEPLYTGLDTSPRSSGLSTLLSQLSLDMPPPFFQVDGLNGLGPASRGCLGWMITVLLSSHSTHTSWFSINFLVVEDHFFWNHENLGDTFQILHLLFMQ